MKGQDKIKIVIWGTGGAARHIMIHHDIWLKNVEIICFVSNSHRENTVEMFYEKPVINPCELSDYTWEYIIICSSFVEEITRQITEELKIERDRILTLETLAKKLTETRGTSIFDKRVLLYGKQYDAYAYIWHIQQRAKSLKILWDGENEPAPGAEVIRPEEIKREEYDYLLLLDREDGEEEELLHRLESTAAEELHDVLSQRDWIANLAFAYKKEKKSDGPTYYCIVPRRGEGLMAIFLHCLRQCEYAYGEGYIPIVDMQNTMNMYLDEEKLGKQNAWEYYFTQPKGAENKILDEIYRNENMVIPSIFVKVNKNRDIVGNRNSLLALKKTYRHSFAIKQDMQRRIEEEYEKIFGRCQGKKVLGCVYRGTDYRNIQPAIHNIQPEPEEYIEVCREKMEAWGCEYIYVATEDKEVLELLKRAFGDRLLYTNQLRYGNTGDKFLAQIHNDRENDSYLRGAEYLETIVLLTRCNCLIGAENGGLYGALLLKEGEYEETYIFQKGRYAVDNRKFL